MRPGIHPDEFFPPHTGCFLHFYFNFFFSTENRCWLKCFFPILLLFSLLSRFLWDRLSASSWLNNLVNFINQFLPGSNLNLSGYTDDSYAIPLTQKWWLPSTVIKRMFCCKAIFGVCTYYKNIKTRHSSLWEIVQNRNNFTHISNTNLSLRIQENNVVSNFKTLWNNAQSSVEGAI